MINSDKTNTLLSVISDKFKKNGRYHVDCICECGKSVTVSLSNIKTGHTKSCGCLVSKVNSTHGMHGTPTHSSWANMIQRCENKNNTRFERYGGRGICVCDSWLHSFESFYFDMGNKPEGKTLDRIDNDGNYSVGNCRWATAKEQSNNRGMQKNNTSGHKWLYWNKSNSKWSVNIKGRHLGYFIDKQVAINSIESYEYEHEAKQDAKTDNDNN